MNPKISIIIPVYNVENYIEDCIKSVLNQTFKEFELLLINDGSTDRSGEICDYFSKIDNRITVIHQINNGPGFTRNKGISLANGNYVGFIDSDDVINDNMLEKMYSIIKKFNADIAVCGLKEINVFENNQSNSITPLGGKIVIRGDEILRDFEVFLNKRRFLGYPSMCNKFYKKSLITNNQLKILENIKIAEDMCFNVHAILSAQIICAVNEPLYNYRRINSESIMNKKESQFYLILEGRNELINSLKLNNINEKVYADYLKYENSNTISEYTKQIIKSIKKKDKLKLKIGRIRYLLKETYFINSLKNFDKRCFILKANIIIQIIKFLVYFEKLINKIRCFLNMRVKKYE